MASIINALTTSGGGVAISGDATGNLALQSAGTNIANFLTTGDLQFNSGYGSVATAYGCRAWVNFDGTGTPAIRASGNVSSITDLGTGFYRINFTNALVDANYALVGTSRLTSENGVGIVVDLGDSTRSTTQATIQTIGGNTFSLIDSAYNNVSFFR